MAVTVFGTVWSLLLLYPSREVPDFLRDLLFIIMGHYFASRRRVEAFGQELGPPPLYLPRGSVRLLLVGGCAAVGLVLYRRGQLAELERNPGAVTLLLVAGFLLGVALNTLGTWWKNRGHTAPRFIEDLRAVVALAATVLLVVLVWNRVMPFFPAEPLDAAFGRSTHLGSYGLEHVLAAVVGFYFGSRS
jgi:hypothetical protein